MAKNVSLANTYIQMYIFDEVKIPDLQILLLSSSTLPDHMCLFMTKGIHLIL